MFHNESSNWNSVFAGVPQDSILGPILFLIYINDIINDIRSKSRLFADDTSLYLIVDNPNESAELLNADLDKNYIWPKQWLIDFNLSKTETLNISRKLNAQHHPDLIMNNTVITPTSDGLYSLQPP